MRTKSKKRLNIGFFTCHLDNDYAYEICKGVDYAAKEADVNLVVFPGMYMNASYNDPKNARFDYQYNSIFYYASEHNLDALIVSIGSIGSFLSESDIIAFLKNFNLPILTIEIEVPGYPYLYTEGKTGMRQAVEHLIHEHHVSKIGFVSGRKENADANDRLETYRQVLRENNIPVDEGRIVYGNFSEYTEDIVNDLLDRNPDLEAIVFANDQMAIGGYTAIKARGLEIGKDILVTGYDDSPTSMVLDPMLTTVHNQIMDMGYHAIYEAINLITQGRTSKNILDSSLIVRSSCGCGDYILSHTDRQQLLSSTSSTDHMISFFIDHFLHDYREAFYYPELLNNFIPVLKMLFQPITDRTLQFDSDSIIHSILELLESPLVKNYFSPDKFMFTIQELNKMLITFSDSIEESNAVAILFDQIMTALVLRTSTTLYNTVKKHKASIWSSMYITKDTMTYSDDEESCFNLIMENLKEAHFDSAYLYIYEEPVMLMPNGAWKIPKTLYLQAYHNNGNVHYLSGNNRMISSEKIFNNQYMDDDRRKTLVLTPLFTNNIQHGLFVGEIDIAYFGNIYPNSLQLAISLNFISLMKQQMSTQQKLAISAAELNEKNILLNKLSITDALTGINNRRGFLDSVQMKVNSKYNEGKQAMLVFADMDNLKQVNDRFGHKNGDFAIKSIAKILTESFNHDDIIGRIGGDEFVAFSFIDNTDRPDQIKTAIAKESEELNNTCGKPYYIDISLGISTFVCSPTLNIEDVLHNADTALYESKKNKRKDVMKHNG
ncbi:MAG: diguanylate cyclase domain-containing protein [Wujia sp.]